MISFPLEHHSDGKPILWGEYVPSKYNKEWGSLIVYCPYCNMNHTHSWTEYDRKLGITPRVAHCFKESSPFFRKEYYLKNVVNGINITKQVFNKRSLIPSRLRFKILEYYDFRCAYCGVSSKDTQLVIDHVVPVSKGGKTVFENLAAACQDCNLGKADNLLQ